MQKATDVTFILDRSGSMGSIKNATIEGFNSFLKDQKKEKEKTTISLVQFDDEYQVVYENKDSKSVKYLTKSTFQPRGMTALLDAIGTTIDRTKERINSTSKDNQPCKVLIVILTDGYENASSIYTREKIFKKIRKRENKDGWEFVFIGSNQDAIKEANSFGIDRKKALTFRNDDNGVKDAMASLTANFHKSRMHKESTFEFYEEDRKKQDTVKFNDLDLEKETPSRLETQRNKLKTLLKNLKQN